MATELRNRRFKPQTTKETKDVSTDVLNRALALIIYGISGIGKTSLAAHFPGAGVFYEPQEDGILDLLEYGEIKHKVFHKRFDSWSGLLRLCDNIADGKFKIKTAVFDALTGIERFCFLDHCKEHFKDDFSKEGFFAYSTGPKQAAKLEIPKFLTALNNIREAGINVILLAHSQVKPFNNPLGKDYDKFTATMENNTWQQLHKWSQAVLFYTLEFETSKQGGLKQKAEREGSRVIYTTPSPQYDAKNRLGLPAEISCGDSSKEAFQALWKALTKRK